MKKIKLLIIGIAVILTMTGCDSSHNTKLPDIDMNTNKSKILVAYFSLSNNAPYGSDVEASSSASIVISNDKKLVQLNIWLTLLSIKQVVTSICFK